MCVCYKLVRSNEGMILNSIVGVRDLAFTKIDFIISKYYYYFILRICFIVKCDCSGEYIEDLHREID